MKRLVIAVMASLFLFAGNTNARTPVTHMAIENGICDLNGEAFNHISGPDTKVSKIGVLMGTSIANGGTKIVVLGCSISNPGPNEKWTCKSEEVVRNVTDRSLPMDENLRRFEEWCNDNHGGS